MTQYLEKNIYNMTFEHFKELTDLMVEKSKKMSSAHDLGVDLYELNETSEDLINKLWSLILTEHGLDWFNWFMYEKNYIHDGVGRSDLTAHSGETPICEDLKGLYEYLVESNYFKISIDDAKNRN